MTTVLRTLPWGTLLTLIALGGVAAAVLTWTVDTPASADAVAAMALACAAAFVLMRGLAGYLCGVLAAMLLLLHPVLRQASAESLLLPALSLTCLASVITAAQLAAERRFTWAWALWSAVTPAALALLWLARPADGLAASLFALIGLAGVALAALYVLPRAARALSNIVAAGLFAVAWPAAGLALAVGAARVGLPDQDGLPYVRDHFDLRALLAAAVHVESITLSVVPDHVEAWAWPQPWVVLPLALFGLWRALWRGRTDWRQQRLPAAWLLLLFAIVQSVAAVFEPPNVLPPAALAVLLSVFGLVDWARSIGERLVLPPPADAPP